MQDYRTDIRNCVETMRKGGVILYPTDTIWGLGCDARNAEAVKRIFNIKKRMSDKSMLLLVDSISSLERIVTDIPEAAEQLIDVAVNPLTIIYDHAIPFPEGVTAADGSVGVRITKEKFSNSLCKALRSPLISTSANVSGQKTPRCFSEITQDIIDQVDYVVKYRQDDSDKPSPSNIIKVTSSNVIKIIR